MPRPRVIFELDSQGTVGGRYAQGQGTLVIQQIKITTCHLGLRWARKEIEEVRSLVFHAFFLISFFLVFFIPSLKVQSLSTRVSFQFYGQMCYFMVVDIHLRIFKTRFFLNLKKSTYLQFHSCHICFESIASSIIITWQECLVIKHEYINN